MIHSVLCEEDGVRLKFGGRGGVAGGFCRREFVYTEATRHEDRTVSAQPLLFSMLLVHVMAAILGRFG